MPAQTIFAGLANMGAWDTAAFHGTEESKTLQTRSLHVH